jgi:tol-pal system protein YbgF
MLQSRLEDVERSNGRLRVRVQDTEERLFLLQDRFEANRIASARRDTESFRVETSRPVSDSPRRRFESPVTSSAPPPYPNVDPLVSSLPVHRLEPGAPAPSVASPAAPVGAEEEVVIDQAAFEARFRGEAPISDSGSDERRPLPPVDVGGHRLPVVTGDAPSDNLALAAPATDVPEPVAGQSPLEVYRAGVDLFNEAEYAGALEAMERFVAMGPEPDYMDNAFYWMGESLYGLGEYRDALAYFERVVREFPDGNKVPDALLKQALSHERLSEFDRAREILATLADTFPTTNAGERAQQRLRDLE